MDFTGHLHHYFFLIFQNPTNPSYGFFLSPTSVLGEWQGIFSDMMVLALISTACISNVICSLQAMLIYARISNAMEAEELRPDVMCVFTFTLSLAADCLLLTLIKVYISRCLLNRLWPQRPLLRLWLSLQTSFFASFSKADSRMEWNFTCYVINYIWTFELRVKH